MGQVRGATSHAPPTALANAAALVQRQDYAAALGLLARERAEALQALDASRLVAIEQLATRIAAEAAPPVDAAAFELAERARASAAHVDSILSRHRQIGRVVAGVLLCVGAGSAIALGLNNAVADCDPNAPLMSLDGSLAMPEPYATRSLLFNATAPICFGLVAGITTRKARFAAGFATWFASGLFLYFLSVEIWKHTCPP
jgi:hypothetical protein